MTLHLPPDALARQRAASDPAVSAWVSAHAGSGKTRVLTDRVIRLLLSGVEPSRILCLTYTKAAAANMANRVFETLGRWAQLDDRALGLEVEALEGRPLRAEERAEARRLFARALECPGGLKVQTIHAFSERLLHGFPFEAGVPASFAVLDEAESAALLERAREETLNEAATDREGALGRAVRHLALAAADGTLDTLMREVVNRRQDLGSLVAREEGFDEALGRLARTLGLEPGAARGELDWFPSPHFSDAAWEECIAALEGSGKSDGAQAARLRGCLAQEGAARLATYLAVYFTQEGEPRKEIFTRGFCKKYPAIAEAIRLEAERLAVLRERQAALETLEATGALLRVACAVIGTYTRLKRERGMLDFDDLVQSVQRLFADEGARWVLYKLDGGIDHVLIDEAQDTSPAQWQIVDRLAEEFFAGEGARVGHRTLFAVGDEKQSIYSFQGARPAQFDHMRRRFQRRADDAKKAFSPVQLVYSFRSTEHVLGAVDRVFERPLARAGLGAVDEAPVHQAVRGKAPGFVEIWPLVEPLVQAESNGWDAPFDARNHDSPPERLAREIATTVRDWLGQGAALEDGRPIGAQDILVLVQRRGALFEAIIRELKTAGVAVAGADRLKLLEHIAVMDLLAAAEFALLPEDDLTLATVLRSPLVGLSEEALFALAHERRGSLWGALRRAAGQDSALETVRARLSGWLDRADFVRPFEFFSGLLTADGGRERLFARLGLEAADALDELLNLALAYERVQTPSLQGFVHWLRHAEPDVKRSLDMARDEVRVMTVHNAKGLEAPIVFLADTVRMPGKGLLSPLVFVDGAGETRSPAWRAPGARDAQAVAAARDASHQAQLGEHRRLLYVAMTRAADRLYVCGCGGGTKRPEGNWYDLVRDALEPEAWEMPAPDGGPARLRWARTRQEDPPCGRPGAAPSDTVLPLWAKTAAQAESVPRPLAVSSLLGTLEAGASAPRTLEDRFAMAADPQRRFALERGTLVHRLLQSLPELQPEQRRAAGERFLTARGPGIDPALAARLVEEVLALFEMPDFAPIFAPGSRPEVPIAGLLTLNGEEKPVSGVIDRLVVLPDRLLLVDYKTNRDPPSTAEATPKAYLVQLAAYRRLLAEIYPDKAIEAGLLWTVVPRLMMLPPALLEAAV